MYQILVVEDNARINKHIVEILRKTFSPDINIESALDGEKAMQYIMDRKIDTLITDIRMPQIGGLELISAVKKRYPDVRTVIISAYEDFKVAQEAIALKVDQYLLKPFDDRQLCEIAGLLYQEYLGQEEDGIKRIVIQAAMGKLSQEEDINITYKMILLRIGAFGLKEEISIEDEIRLHIGKQTEKKDYVIFRINRETFCLVFYSKLKEELHLKALAMYLVKMFSEEYKMVNILISKQHEDVMKLHERSMAAYQELSCLLIMGKNSVWDEGEKQTQEDIIEFEKQLADLKHEVEVKMKTRCRQGMVDCLNTFWENKELQKYPAIFMKRVVVGIVEKMLEVSGCMLEGNLLEIVEDGLRGCFCQDDVLNVLLNIYEKVENMRADSKGTAPKELCTRIQEYIKKNVYGNITLQSLAEEFHFSESYIVRIVSQQTGITPMKWSVIYKIEEAKNMFRANPNLKIGYVSDQLGFSDQRYFCKVFKNYVHATVTEYKELYCNLTKEEGKDE